MNHEDWIDKTLDAMRADHLERRIQVYPAVGGRFERNGRTLLNFSTNDYLDLSRNPDVVRAAEQALRQYGAGATASRLVTGTLPIHDELERRLAEHKGYPAALLFGSGYMTNAGVVSALVGPHDTVYVDRLVHASVIDAVLLSRARMQRFRHNHIPDLAQRLRNHTGGGRQLIITESLFSMDGDLAPLPELADLAEQHGAVLMVDEAHATGVYGPRGAGLVAEHRLQSRVQVCMGTLSKALGGYGGFIACSEKIRALMINKARALIYTTALPPPVVAGASAALHILEQQPDRGRTLLQRAAQIRDRLQQAGLNTLHSASQIIPVLVGDNEKALDLSRRLLDRGMLVVAMRPPTVPPGMGRLRLSLTLAHSDKDIQQAADILVHCAREVNLL